MTGEIEHKPRYRQQIPDSHRSSLDTRIAWLWSQKLGTIMTIWQASKDALDHTAATLYLQAIRGEDLSSIELILQRLEGSTLLDDALLDQNPDDVVLKV